MIREIRCDSCRRPFQTMDCPVEQTAAAFGWHVGDVTLCPCCADLWADDPGIIADRAVSCA